MSWRNDMYSETERALQAETNRLRMVVRDLEDQIEGLKNQVIDWIPVESGVLPGEGQTVLVTYIGNYDNKPHCNDSAYIINNEWHWHSNGWPIKVKITAWKPVGEPYRVRDNGE